MTLTKERYQGQAEGSVSLVQSGLWVNFCPPFRPGSHIERQASH